MVAVIAHALGVIRRDVFGEDCDAAALALAALYHDAPEILTGDMPTPIKYHSGEITAAYREVERAASDKLVNMLPVEFRREFAPLISGDVGEDLAPLLKCADRLSAYIKCVEERKAGEPRVPLRREADPGPHTLHGPQGGGLFSRKLHAGLREEPRRAGHHV